ncbi:hypothetical protein OZX72_04860 [Bifidobacterium sp. ESL0769]|uniref:hypothetical protein n=1 Tax=Bifidobacterium sp. ESL0769 TaxID=2983229 RepID=UPI0023F6EBD8|nr:hypothetical protein [Bifidobacterium sp. ESL0769]WEV68303.1 hypothetical protein OZX72_04860 [Bifidobacterium sp. ESL0769]
MKRKRTVKMCDLVYSNIISYQCVGMSSIQFQSLNRMFLHLTLPLKAHQWQAPRRKIVQHRIYRYQLPRRRRLPYVDQLGTTLFLHNTVIKLTNALGNMDFSKDITEQRKNMD